ncbi:hypothetical protein, partial [Ferruginibacter sp.]
ENHPSWIVQPNETAGARQSEIKVIRAGTLIGEQLQKPSGPVKILLHPGAPGGWYWKQALRLWCSF